MAIAHGDVTVEELRELRDRYRMEPPYLLAIREAHQQGRLAALEVRQKQELEALQAKHNRERWGLLAEPPVHVPN
jgi:hypothetical protein